MRNNILHAPQQDGYHYMVSGYWLENRLTFQQLFVSGITMGIIVINYFEKNRIVLGIIFKRSLIVITQSPTPPFALVFITINIIIC